MLASCSPTHQVGFGASRGVHDPVGAAFEAQKVDVEFVSAWSRYQQGDRSGTVKYLDRAMTAMRQKGGGTSTIASLSKKVSSGKKVSESEFQQTFAASHREMAGQQRSLVDRLLAKNQERSAGSSMQAMAYHTERSAEWSGQPLSSQEQSEVSTLRSVGSALQTGSGILVKGSGYIIQGTGWVLGKGFSLLTAGGERTVGRTGSVMRGTGTGGETGSQWIQNAGGGVKNFGDWILRK